MRGSSMNRELAVIASDAKSSLTSPAEYLAVDESPYPAPPSLGRDAVDSGMTPRRTERLHPSDYAGGSPHLVPDYSSTSGNATPVGSRASDLRGRSRPGRVRTNRDDEEEQRTACIDSYELSDSGGRLIRPVALSFFVTDVNIAFGIVVVASVNYWVLTLGFRR